MSLRISGLRKRYGTRRALDVPSLVVPQGSVVLVTGANGAGKSTLLRCVAGVAAHDGSIERPRGPVAYLPQGEVLPPAATVAEVLRLFGTPAAGVRDWVSVDGARRIGTLSGGERQRVALAVVLSLDAPLVVLDEPFADLDGAAADALIGRIAALRARGATVLIAAPDRDTARIARLADSVVRLADGRSVGDAETSAA